MNAEQISAAERLRDFVRAQMPGGCELLSDPSCYCPLCDLDRLIPTPQKSPFTKHQATVMGFVAKGLTDKEIGGLMQISPFTIGDHIKAIYRILGVGNRAEAVGYAKDKGWV